MKLQGSCHCGAVSFSLETKHPYPFNHCYCSICRKTQGAGGYAINLSGDADTLDVSGAENITVYQVMTESGPSSLERRFCSRCGSGLWCWDPRWPELLHPFASAIDSELPVPPERTHLMLGSKAGWVPVNAGPEDKTFDKYPDESISAWHKRLKLDPDSDS